MFFPLNCFSLLLLMPYSDKFSMWLTLKRKKMRNSLAARRVVGRKLTFRSFSVLPTYTHLIPKNDWWKKIFKTSGSWLKHQTTSEGGNLNSMYLIGLSCKYLNTLQRQWNHITLIDVLRNIYFICREVYLTSVYLLNHKNNIESHILSDIFFFWPGHILL